MLCPLTLGGRSGSRPWNLPGFIALEANVCGAVLIYEGLQLELSHSDIHSSKKITF